MLLLCRWSERQEQHHSSANADVQGDGLCLPQDGCDEWRTFFAFNKRAVFLYCPAMLQIL